MQVAFLPVWPINPYHDQLATALRPFGVQVMYPASLKALYGDFTSGASRPDVLHLHTMPGLGGMPVNWAWFVLSCLRLHKLMQRGLNVVWTVHDLHNHDSRTWRIESFVHQRLARRLDALIVHGETARKLVEAHWGRLPCPIRVIPHGHYVHSYPNTVGQAEARRALSLADSDLVLLCIGLIEPYKGTEQMVQAFLRCSEPRARLVIAGKCNDERLRRSIEASVAGDSRIRFIEGRIPNESMQVYLNASDVVVLPYVQVFTSGVAILAMSFGKPCIAPRTGGVADALDEQGAFFFDQHVDGDLLRSVHDALRTPRDDLGAMGRHNADRARGWDWDEVARATAEVYRQAVSQRQVRTRNRAPRV